MNLRLVYRPEHVKKPILAEIVLRKKVRLNILDAKVNSQKGELIVSVPLDGEQLKDLIKHSPVCIMEPVSHRDGLFGSPEPDNLNPVELVHPLDTVDAAALVPVRRAAPVEDLHRERGGVGAGQSAPVAIGGLALHHPAEAQARGYKIIETARAGGD
jgi:hypothetical protein